MFLSLLLLTCWFVVHICNLIWYRFILALLLFYTMLFATLRALWSCVWRGTNLKINKLNSRHCSHPFFLPQCTLSPLLCTKAPHCKSLLCFTWSVKPRVKAKVGEKLVIAHLIIYHLFMLISRDWNELAIFAIFQSIMKIRQKIIHYLTSIICNLFYFHVVLKIHNGWNKVKTLWMVN